ncbi:MAG: hypothetical protein ABSF33_04505 [Acidimicrobiales bacterium]|jgi:hypothetical protein
MSELRQLKRQTRTLLTELGTTPDEVFESLNAAGVNGVPKDNRSCAVARYLTALMGSDPRVRAVNVGHCSLLIDTAAPPEFRPTGRLLVQLPKPVRQFVAAFDARRYPAIIQEQPAAGTAAAAGPRSAR